jgi:hypothetical protein
LSVDWQKKFLDLLFSIANKTFLLCSRD